MSDNLIKTLAEGVMEWEERNIWEGLDGKERPWWFDPNEGEWINPGGRENWNPLTDWNDCMMLVEQMREDGFEFKLKDIVWGEDENLRTTYCHFYKKGECFEYHTGRDLKETICIAIAKARGLEWR